MDFSFRAIMGLVQETVITPRLAARRIMAMGLGADFAWMALFLMAVGSAFLTHLSFALSPAPMQEMLGGLMASPIRTAIVQGMVMVVSVFLVHRMGLIHSTRKASFAEAILLVTWLQFVLLCAQLLQIVALLILPPLSDVIGLAGLVVFFWVLANFVTELHGYRSVFLSFLAVFALLVLMGVLLAILLTIFVGPIPGGA
ncbi:MAG: YIP1 family protein [Pseudorhodobacter sp.]